MKCTVHHHHHDCSTKLPPDYRNNLAEDMTAEELQPYLDLFQKSVEAREHAYAPNSNFRVGAALLARDGSIYTGSNKELTVNADHAEQRAINNALLDGQKPKDIIAAAIFGGRGEVALKHFEDRTAACGNCRQALQELNPDMLIVGADGPGQIQIYEADEELPDAYYRERTLQPPPEAIDHQDPLVDAALEARSRSYVPRSRYPVGAAVETDKGIFVGMRAEVSSYASQAARMAIGTAMEAGATTFLRLAIIGGTEVEEMETPDDVPFDSLEALFELNPDASVVLPTQDGEVQELKRGEAFQVLLD